MTCRELTEFLLEYQDETLPPEKHAVFEQHLAECPSCVGYLETYRETILLERGAFTDPDRSLPADVPEDLIQAILAARSR